MATEIRPELSEKNPVWIGKHRYYELKHFCLQYPIWKKAYNALLGLSSRPNDLDIFVKSGQVRSDPTARCAESRVSFDKRKSHCFCDNGSEDEPRSCKESS